MYTEPPPLTTLNNMSQNGTTYANAVAPGSWTAPTHAALFANKKVSGISQVSQNFLSNGTYKIDPWMVKTKFLPKNENTLAKKLSALNYQSVLLSNNPFLTSFTNLAVGFDHVHDIWLESNVKYNKSLAKNFSFINNGGAKAREAMINTGYAATRLLPSALMDSVYINLRKRMLKAAANTDGTYKLDRGATDANRYLKNHLAYSYNYKPQFMFINYMEAHENYPAEEKVVQDKWLYLSGIEDMSDYNMKQLHKGYLKRLKYLDGSIKFTLKILKEKGILENATVIVTSDHGQFFGEHGMMYHSLPPYEGVSKVPLIAANYKDGKMIKARDWVETPVSVSALHDSVLNLASGKFDYLNGNLRRDNMSFASTQE